MKRTLTLFFAAALTANCVHAQNTFPSTGSTGIGTLAPNASSLLEINSITKGFLPPRMTQAQRNAIVSPATGLMIYQTNNTPGFYYFGGTGWNAVTPARANTTLSNLASPTAINQSLVANANNTLDLGSSSVNWRNIYSSGNFYNGANRFLSVRDTANTFLGYGTGTVNSGNYNSFIGNSAGASNTTASGNSFCGFSAGYLNTTASLNTAMGFRALYANQTGSYNAAFGDHALYSTGGTAGGNSAFGSASMVLNTTGSQNTTIGATSMYRTTTGNNNSALGAYALVTNETGSNNTAIGNSADVTSPDLNTATAIGAGALVNASYKVVVGSTNVTVIGGQVGWSILSDGRFKKNLKENVPGLDFINKLKPVTYNVDIEKFERFTGRKDSAITAMRKDIDINTKKIRTGFIAQDVEKTANEIGYDFDGVNKPQNEKDNYSIVYADFVPSLVKAVQELSKKNDAKDAKIDDLQKQIDDLKAAMALGSQSTSTSSNVQTVQLNNSAALEQNIPNPFANATTINYALPQHYNKAVMIITDKTGKTVKEISLGGNGKGTVKLDASSLSNGTYHYSLYIDGRITDSKQMLLGK